MTTVEKLESGARIGPSRTRRSEPKPLNLVITVTPSDNAFTIAELCRDAVELCRRLNVEAVKFRHGKVTYYAHKDHVVRKVRSNSWDVLREPYGE